MIRKLDKYDIEAAAESKALQRQGRSKNINTNRIKQTEDYNKDKFNKLFWSG